MFADGLDRVYPHGEQGDDEEGWGEGWEGGKEEEEEEEAIAALGPRGEGEGGEENAIFRSDFDGVEAEEEREEGVVAAAVAKDPSEMRLSRRIARSGIASRREAER